MVVNESSSMMPTKRRRRAPTVASTFECDCWVFYTVSLEVAPGDERNLGVFDGHRGRRIGATIKDWQFCYGFAGIVHGQNLFTATQ